MPQRAHRAPTLHLALQVTLCLALAACSADKVLIELAHPVGFDPATQQGTLEVALFEAQSGALVSKSTVSLAALAGEAPLAEGLALSEGRRYRLVVAGELQSAGCASNSDRMVGRSPPFRFGAGDTVVQVYVDCVGRSSPTSAGLAVKRFFHSATRLAGPTAHGSVLIAGGMELKSPGDIVDLTKGELHDTIELFDVRQNRFRLLEARLSRSRVWHQATAVDEDRVVISGGATLVEVIGTRRFEALDLVEAIAEERLSVLGKMSRQRYGHSTLRLDGRLLIAGGVTETDKGFPVVTSEAELYDIASGQSLGQLPKMSAGRSFAMAAAVGDGGDALIAGGRWLNNLRPPEDRFCLQGNACGCEAPCFESVEGFPTSEGRYTGAAVAVQCAGGSGAGGAVYVIGGRHDAAGQIPAKTYKDIYCYDLTQPKTMRRVGELQIARAAHTASLISPAPGGGAPRIFVAGGIDDAGDLRSDAELFEAPCRCPATLKPPAELIPLSNLRYGHSATVLADGSVLLVGGLVAESSAERFVPDF